MFFQIISITPCELAFDSLHNSQTSWFYAEVKKIIISEPQR